MFSLNTNGFIGMGTSTEASFEPIGSGNTNNIICALGGDLQGTGSATTAIRYETIGSAPNRTLVIQWKHYKKYGSFGDDWNFQIRLNETTNDIKLVYGTFVVNDTDVYFQTGLRGDVMSDFNNRTTSNNWSATTAGGTATESCILTTTVFPVSGTTFVYSEQGASSVPNPVTLVIPAADAINVSCSVRLQWNAGSGFPDGYKVYFGTDNPPTTLVSTQPGTDYVTPSWQAANTDYYWKIVPYNDFGDAAGCPVWHFRTGNIYDVTMQNGSTNIPEGNSINFYDTGGATSAYQNGEDYIYTFYAPAGKVIQAVFSAFESESGYDGLAAYDGIDATAPLIGLWEGMSNPGTITSSGTALTFVWYSDVSVVYQGWAAVVSVYPTSDILAGIDTPVNGITINSTIDLNIDPAVTNADPILMALPAYNAAGSTVMAFNGTGIGNLTVSVPAGNWYLGIYDGTWHWSVPNPFTGPGTYTFIGINYGAKADAIVLLSPVDPTLPVELSSFTAVLTAECFVNLQWVTESETQVLGYNVYRSETADVADAIRVNPAVIAATNTSEQHTYSISDSEVETNATYYYWLENVDMGGGNALHGPQTVTVTGNTVPALPVVSMLSSAYPNPFRSGSNTKINVAIKAGETGNVTVYNVRGQVVKSFSVQEGTHTLNWDGKNCGSGVYFYRLTTPTLSSTRKLAIVK